MANDTPPKYVEVPFSRSLRMAAMIMHDKLALAEPMVPPVASAIVERGHCLNHDSEPGVLSARIATAVTAAAAVATTQPLAHALLRKISAMAKMAVEYTMTLTRAYISHVKAYVVFHARSSLLHTVHCKTRCDAKNPKHVCNRMLIPWQDKQ